MRFPASAIHRVDAAGNWRYFRAENCQAARWGKLFGVPCFQ